MPRLEFGGFGAPLLLVFVLASAARAEAPSVASCVDRLDEAQVTELLAFTEGSLRDQRLGASLWFSGWTAFNLTNVGVGIWKTIDAPSQLARDTWLVSTIGAGIFVIGATVLPMPGLYASLRLGRMPAATPEERRAKLRRGLTLLESAAKAEDRNSNLTAHIAGLIFAVLGTGYVYLHNLDESRHALVAATVPLFAFSVVGAEATLWSVPRRARRDLAKLRARDCAARSAKPQAVAGTFIFGLGPGTVRLGGTF